MEQSMYELEKKLKEFLSSTLNDFSSKLTVEFKNLLLEREKEFAKLLNDTDREIVLIKKDIENIKSDIHEICNKSNEFKKEVREKITVLEHTEDQVKGGISTGKWVIGTIIAVVTIVVNLALRFFGVK